MISFRSFVPRWAIVLLPIFAVPTVGLRHAIIKSNIESHRLDRESHRILREVDTIQAQVAQLRSPRRLEALAKRQWNWNPPRADQWIRIQDSSTTPQEVRSSQKLD